MKKVNLRTVALVLAFVLSFACVGFAGSAADYDADAALKYAAEHAKDGVEPGTNKADCIEFSRTCVEAGGIPRDESKVFKNGNGYTVKAYTDYLLDNGYAVLNKLKTRTVNTTDGSGRSFEYVHQDDNAGKVAPGDIILYKCTNKDCKKGYFHATICAAPGEDKHVGFYRYYGHNPIAEGDKPLCTINCYGCKSKDGLELYALHITSKDNGFESYDATTTAKVKCTAYNKLKVSWNKVSDADGYVVFYRASSKAAWEKIAEVTGTSYTHKIAKEYYGATQYFKVTPYKSMDGRDVMGQASKEVSGYTVPAAPKTVTLKQTGDRDVKVSWSKVSGAVTYKVEYKLEGSSKWSHLYRGSKLTATRKGLSAGKKYEFRVTTFTSSKNYTGERPSNKYTYETICTFKLVKEPTVKRLNSKTVKVSWNNVSSESGYEISQSTSKTKDGTITTVKGKNAKSAKISAKKGKKYYYKVRAYKFVGDEKVYGSWSPVKYF